MIRRPPRSTRTDTLSLHDALPIFQIDLFARQQRGVAAIGDLDLLQHLADDHFDVLVVDLHALQPVDFLDLVHEILRSEEHTSELQSLMRISYAVFCLKKKKNTKITDANKHKNT